MRVGSRADLIRDEVVFFFSGEYDGEGRPGEVRVFARD